MRWVKQSTARARALRRRETKYEERLWPWLRAGRLLGQKFRRQHPAGPYFLDFASPSLLLAIELDGAGHFERSSQDRIRDDWLREQGWKVLRFGNHDIQLRLSTVLETIVSEVRRKVHPSP